MKKRISPFVPALWIATAGCWTATLGVDFYYKVTPAWLVAMHGVTASMSWIAAIINYIRYKNQEESSL